MPPARKPKTPAGDAATSGSTSASGSKPPAGVKQTPAADAKTPADAKTSAAKSETPAKAAKTPAAGAKATVGNTPVAAQTGAQRIGLHSLKPAPGSRRPRKRVGRGEGSGTGKTSGRGQKGAGSRSGSKDRTRFEGGQMPIHMRMRKLRGPTKKMSMPFEPFRTHTQPVNVGDLEARFDAGADVTLQALVGKGLGTRKGIAVKVLAKGELNKALTVHAHRFSGAAREKIEGAGGTCVLVDH